MKQLWFPFFLVTFSFGFNSAPTSAQVTSDGTLSNPTRVEQQGNVLEITEGTTEGSNLFHSFRNFSVPKGMEAYFKNNTAITNIFSRVTGGDISQINGLIRANGNANLFLLNPNGIIFGENASLNIGGSFLATSAESIFFNDGTIFSTTDTQTQPLLTISVPIGLNLAKNPGTIINRSQAIGVNEELNSVGLQVIPGKTLALVGGEIVLEGGKITVPGGIVNIGGLAEEGKIGINNNGSLSFPQDVARADVLMINGASVNVLAGGRGNINVNAKNLELREGSQLLAGISKDIVNPKAVSGDIRINATNNILLSQGSSISSVVEAGGIGNSGRIDIKTNNLFMTEGGKIDASTYGIGNTGKITINASGTISADNASGKISADTQNESGITSIVRREGIGNSGGIEIQTTDLSLIRGGRVSASVFGKGDAGKIVINASGNISADGRDRDGFTSRISNRTGKTGVGNSEGIEISTNNLSLTRGGVVEASTLGKGNASPITINASGSILVDGANVREEDRSEISSIVRDGGVGNSGGIAIETNNLYLKEGGTVSASTFGIGNTGKITIDASGSILVEGKDRLGITSRISSRVGKAGIGNSEGIEISTNNLYLAREGKVIANTIGKGKAGNIFITAKNIEATSGSQIETNSNTKFNAADINLDVSDRLFLSGAKTGLFAQTESAGTAGAIKIQTAELTIDRGASISAFTKAKGRGGTIILDVSDRLALSDPGSGIFANTEPESKGNGGSILTREQTRTQNITVTNEAAIAVNSQGSGTGGNINLLAEKITLENSSITAATDSGEGGNIAIADNDVLLFKNNGRITASAGQKQAPGNGGNIDIDSNFILSLPTENLNTITANAFAGKGGKIDINTNNILGRSSIKIDASSRFGLDGIVKIDTPEIDPTSGIIELSDVAIDAEAILAQNLCKFEDEKIAKGSSFYITGRGGLTPTSSDPLENVDRVINWSERDDLQISKNGIVAVHHNSARETTAKGDRVIEQAQGWVVTSDGNVWLTKAPPQGMLQKDGIHHPDCHRSTPEG